MKINRNPTPERIANFEEELGDVKIMLEVVLKQHNTESIKKSVKEKITRMKKYL